MRKITLTSAVAVAALAGFTLAGCGSSHPAASQAPASHAPASHAPAPTAASVLRADGYPVDVTLDKAQISQLNGADTAFLKGYISSMVAGIKGGHMEEVMTLTPAGQQSIAAAGPNAVADGAGHGATARMADGYLVVVMPAPAS